MNNILLYIVGTTAIGKTAMSIKLANHFKCSIISCDSRQFYKEMTIGTAVPNCKELEGAKHFFIQNKSIFNDFNAGIFENEALGVINNLYKENPLQIMVGGSPMYGDAVINGLDFFPKIPLEIREDLNKVFKKKGIKFLQNQLKKFDNTTYNKIAINNPHRLIRALEICIGTGKPYSFFKNKPKQIRNFRVIKIGLISKRELIYERINKRVELMMEKGLLDEVKGLYKYKNLNALKSVGYNELFNFLDNKSTLDQAVMDIKKNTRRFAKRQLTWYRKDKSINWFDYNIGSKKIIEFIESKLYII